ncbi:F-box/kelch-repeat protein At3g06240-like isoform X2 [Gastrolobium bilobum]|uniref:F-box/kelch-repeat protein At3g06240-like isoform X2 n=1 Tax=Gastrolobium bilobum TaxID=150636 RepID=UPI002AB2C681|nr:F-box/kelch-repeat protein At3g06240-like isoform X2 [Gastrolobium bilobum]
MSVCKTWNTMIKSHTFISSHLQHSLSNNPLFLIRDLTLSNQEQYSLCSSSFRIISNPQYSFSLPSNKFLSFVGSLNGVVCLYDNNNSNYIDNIILWNPLIRKHLQLPTPIFTSETLGEFYTFALGLGFDSKRNDFKVVRVCYDLNGRAVPPKVELYSLNDGAWRVIDASYLELRVIHCTKQLIFHGNVHWLAYKVTEGDPYGCNCIMMFNVEKEMFNEMKLPEELGTVSSNNLAISVIDGWLSVIEYSSFRSYGNTRCDIWMCREESWSKIYCVDLERGFTELLGLSTLDEVLLVPFISSYRRMMSLRSFDLISLEMKDIGIQITGKGLCASDFTESLVLLDKESNAAVSLWEHDDEWVSRD